MARVDTWAHQIVELAAIQQPGRVHTPTELDALGEEIGHIWVTYPWRATAVRTVPAPAFRTLRLARNRHKITPSEQATLLCATVGVVGLSVGRAAAVTLAMAGVGGTLRLADRDTLDLSNLNRLAGSLVDLGTPKVVLAARAVAELDPFLAVEVFPEGITADTVNPFVDGLDLLVEECDDMAMKVQLRLAARARGVPVVTDTSDRGMLDVERFDIDPSGPLLHGLLDPSAPPPTTPQARLAFVARLLGVEALSPRSAASVLDHGRLGSWPQLADDVALGGAVVTHAARSILLGDGPSSGRYHVDVEALLGGGGHAPPVAPAATVQPTMPPGIDLDPACWSTLVPALATFAVHSDSDPVWATPMASDADTAELRRLASRADTRRTLAAAGAHDLLAGLLLGVWGPPNTIRVVTDAAHAGHPRALTLGTDATAGALTPLAGAIRSHIDSVGKTTLLAHAMSLG